MPFQKGQSGNPGGRGTTKRWAEAIDKAIKRYANAELKIAPGEALDRLAEKLLESALAGDKDAWTEIGNRLDGKPHMSLEVDSHVTHHTEEMDEAQLERIAAGGSAGAAKKAPKPQKSNGVH